MSELVAVRCTGCGGSVRANVGLPRCLFCGEAQLVPTDPPEGIEPPVGYLAFEVAEGDADGRFRAFATSSFWYPNDLRQARIELHRLQLPAWAWSGDVETHWTGLVTARQTRSDKAPVSGVDHAHFDQILVPASNALRLGELRSLGRYDEGRLRGEMPEGDPMELSILTRSAAQARAQREMMDRHAAAIVRARELLTIRASSVATEMRGRPVLVPVWIGAFKYGKRTFRVLVNGQTGVLVGQAPISPWKVAGAVLAVVATIGVVVGIVLAFASFS